MLRQLFIGCTLCLFALLTPCNKPAPKKVTATAPLTITTTSLPDATVGVPYSFQFVASETSTWQGNFPSDLGLVLETNGLLHGTPLYSAQLVFSTAPPAAPTSLRLTITDNRIGLSDKKKGS